MIKYVLLFCFLSACSTAGKQGAQVCTVDSGINRIRQLPGVVVQEHYIDSITHHHRGLTYIDTDQGKPSDLSYYEVQVGYSSPIRYENFFTFRIDKKSCEILIENDNFDFVPVSEL